MCTTVFQEKESIWFVGGRGDGSGVSDDNGGCTKEWWDNQPDKSAALAKLMTGNGGPIVGLEEVSYTGDDEDTIYSAGAFADVEVGMVAYVIENGPPDTNVATGRYEITAVTDDEITLDGVNGSDCDVDIRIGGAFDALDTAVDETSASWHSVTIYTNLDETVASSVSITAGGNSSKNTFKKIIGYNTLPGDMSRGGAYYESPLEILQTGSIDNMKAVLLDGDNGGNSIFNITADNIIIENFHVYNTGSANLFTFTGTPQNIVLRNCRFSVAAGVFNTGATSVLADSCYSHSDLTGNHYLMVGNLNVILNCVGNVAADRIFAVVATVEGSQVIGCIAINGARGIRVFSYDISAMNNTFYNQTVYGVDLNNATRAIVFNNIFDLAPGAIGLSITTAGSFIYNDHNCFIESDGTPLTVGGHESGYEVPVKGKHSVQVDPDFVDVANGDFRVRNPEVLRGGKCGPNGNAAVIGAIGQEYQFGRRARVMNQGRMGIIR